MAEFQIIVQPEAERTISEILTWVGERSPPGAIRWHAALLRAVDRLRQQADSFPLAHESSHFHAEIRELLFKTRRGLPYRILFTIEANVVHILYVRGPGQDWVE